MSGTAISKRIIFIFLDGVGIGAKDSRSNPFFVGEYPAFNMLFNNSIPILGDAHRSSGPFHTIPLDATLGVPGFPQSGTGQTTLLTGMNAAEHVGKHFGPHPYSTLRPMLKEKNIFKMLHAKGHSVLFANAYPQKYFEYIAKRPIIIGANALAWILSGFDLKNHNDLLAGNALSADITNDRWDKLGHPEIPKQSAFEAGMQLAKLSSAHDFVFYEYYQTDKAGHNQSMSDAVAILGKIDEMLGGILDSIDLEETLLLLTSDHGNMEDLTVRTHTLNPVPFIAAGNGGEKIQFMKSLMDVAPFILSHFS